MNDGDPRVAENPGRGAHCSGVRDSAPVIAHLPAALRVTISTSRISCRPLLSTVRCVAVHMQTRRHRTERRSPRRDQRRDSPNHLPALSLENNGQEGTTRAVSGRPLCCSSGQPDETRRLARKHVKHSSCRTRSPRRSSRSRPATARAPATSRRPTVHHPGNRRKILRSEPGALRFQPRFRGGAAYR
jgi:hypothetical protein